MMSISTAKDRAIEMLLIVNAAIKEAMNMKDTLTLHSAGIVRIITEKRIIHISDTSITYLYFRQRGVD